MALQATRQPRRLHGAVGRIRNTRGSPMRIAYFDCFSGASGDMILAACVDAGLDVEQLRQDLAALGLGGYRIEASSVCKQGFAATRFEVHLAPEADRPHRHLKDIREILEAGRLPDRVRRQAEAIFTRLAEAEAKVHGTPVEQIHFHEVGAVDAVVDIVGACLALDRLGIEQVRVSPIPTGGGSVRCEHGSIPVPAPATAELLKGVPLADCDEVGELITPTGAAILTTLAHDFGPVPAMVIRHIGIGAGSREGRARPNLLRLLIGEAVGPANAGEADEILAMEANLDDISGELVGYVIERLFDTGALDVFCAPIYMKKNRPATRITVLAPPALREALEEVLFAETTTFGIRTYPVRRSKLSRTVEKVRTEFGEIRVKVGRRGGSVVRVAPEFEDCREAARRSGRPLIEVMELTRQAWQRQAGASRRG